MPQATGELTISHSLTTMSDASGSSDMPPLNSDLAAARADAKKDKQEGKVCNFFVYGECTKGDDCRFRHPDFKEHIKILQGRVRNLEKDLGTAVESLGRAALFQGAAHRMRSSSAAGRRKGGK